MKKLPLFALLALALFCVLPLAAQEPIPKNEEAELYPVNIMIEKVAPDTKGYVVVYRPGSGQLGTAFIPYEWFQGETIKASLMLVDHGRLKYSMTLFYKGGEFHSVRLYLPKDYTNPIWAKLAPNVNYDKNFEGVEKLDIKF